MKPLKTLGSFFISASALLFVTSCNKTLDESITSRDVSRLSSGCGNCGEAINLNMSATNPGSNYFWVGARNDVSGRQNFISSDFSDNKYFNVTATGGVPFTNRTRIGVSGVGENSTNIERINVGESLSFELSNCMSDFKMTGLVLVLSGGSSGTIDLFDGANPTPVKTIPYSNTTGGNFSVSYLATGNNNHSSIPYFTKVTLSPTTGWINVRGFQPNNLNGSPTTKFFLADMQNAVYMRTTNNTSMGDVRYINLGPHPSDLDTTTNRQNKQPDPSGEFNVGSKQWLKISATGGNLFFNGATAQMRLGVQGLTGNAGAIEASESIIIEPGTDFSSTHFAGFEFKEATGSNQKLNVELFDGAVSVGTFQTTGGDQNHNLFYGSRPFNKVVITGTVSPSSLAGIGRGGSRVMSAFPSCPKN